MSYGFKYLTLSLNKKVSKAEEQNKSVLSFSDACTENSSMGPVVNHLIDLNKFLATNSTLTLSCSAMRYCAAPRIQ